jgi:hypothetical protein
MTDMPRRAPWWLIALAAFMAFLFLAENIGEVPAAALCAVSLAGFLGYRFFRGRRPARAPSNRCLTCGETLSATARQCQYCGSASWTVKQ